MTDLDLFLEAQRLALARAAWLRLIAVGGTHYLSQAHCQEQAERCEARIAGLGQKAEGRARLAVPHALQEFAT